MKARCYLLTVLASTAVITLASTSAFAQRRRAVRPAGKVTQPADLIAAHSVELQGADIETAVKAAATLGAIKEAGALNALLDALSLGLHPKVAAAALDGLAQHADIKAYETLAFYLHYRDPRVRAAAIRAAGTLDDPRVAGHVVVALGDMDTSVRAAAIQTIAARKWLRGVEPMVELLKKGDEATAPALAVLATPDLARVLGEFIGVAPDFLLARTLGGILLRPDFGPETARVQVVRTLAKVPGNEAITQLERYVQAIPANPPRQSRREAEALVKARKNPGAQPAGGQKPGGAQPASTTPGAQPASTTPGAQPAGGRKPGESSP